MARLDLNRVFNRGKTKMSYRCPLLVLVALFSWASLCLHAEETKLRVMTINILHGGVRLGQPLSQTAKIIREAKADLVGMQECLDGSRDSAAEVAKQLGWHYLYQGNRTAILSRHEIVGHTPEKTGAHIKLPNGTVLHLFNVHFPASPYQPYQLAMIPYGAFPYIKTAKEAVHWANIGRGQNMGRLLNELIMSLEQGIPCFVTGDFNEPSFQDWTDRSVKSGAIPLAVAWPATTRLVQAGMQDGYRTIYSNEIKNRGWTWTPTTKPTDPRDRHDRIDFVFGSKKTTRPVQAAVVGENNQNANIVVSPWPTDHRGVVVEFKIGVQ